MKVGSKVLVVHHDIGDRLASFAVLSPRHKLDFAKKWICPKGQVIFPKPKMNEFLLIKGVDSHSFVGKALVFVHMRSRLLLGCLIVRLVEGLSKLVCVFSHEARPTLLVTITPCAR